jgi:Proteasome non-ATPase 26S subunit
MGQTKSGGQFLAKMGVIDLMMFKLTDEHTDSILKCGIIKFWGLFIHNQHLYLSSLDIKSILSALNHLLEEYTMKDSCMVAIANIASKYEGLLAIYDHGEILQSVMQVARTASGDMKASCLVTIANMLDHAVSKDIDIPAITFEIFNQLCIDFLTAAPKPLQFLLQCANSAMEDLSVQAYNIFFIIVRFEWGLNLLNKSELSRFILERNAAFPRYLQQLKWDICRRVVDNDMARDTVNELGQFEGYVREGAFAVSGAPVVAFQSA